MIMNCVRCRVIGKWTTNRERNEVSFKLTLSVGPELLSVWYKYTKRLAILGYTTF